MDVRLGMSACNQSVLDSSMQDNRSVNQEYIDCYCFVFKGYINVHLVWNHDQY